MNREGTYEELFAIRHDIMKQRQAHASFAYLHSNKIKNFFELNKMRLEILDTQLKMIYDNHVSKDDNGVYKKSEDGKVWVYKSKDDEVSFHKKFTELMKMQILIIS